MNLQYIKDQYNCVTIQDSDTSNLLDDTDFEQGIDALMSEQGLYEPTEYKLLANELER